MKFIPPAAMAMACALSMLSCSSSEAPKVPQAPTAIAPPAMPQQAPQAADPAAAAPATAVAQLNPAHGEPGHRCDIPVGAPLDGSTPAASPSLPAFGTAPAGVPASAAAPVASGKINPPHGEPGHDCAVPVGSPLP